jgi:glutamyl-tRNA reductase
MTGATTLHVRSINHKTAPTAVRERAHLTEVRAAELMDALSAGSTGAGGVRGEPDCVSVIPVSTCNRTEIYLEVKVASTPTPFCAGAHGHRRRARPVLRRTCAAPGQP